MTLKRTCSKNSIALAIIAALGTATAAHAQKTFSTTVAKPTYTTVDTFTTTTDINSSKFNRPLITLGGLDVYSSSNPAQASGAQTAVGYVANMYTPTTAGSYRITNTTSDYGTNGDGTSNFVQFLYSPTFQPTTADPASTQTAVAAYNPVGSSESYSFNLSANTPYTFVNGGRYSDTAANNANFATHSIGTAATTIDLYNPGSLTTIPDAYVVQSGNPPTGSTVPTPVSQKLTVTDSTIITSFDGITIIGLSHPTVGDLTATLSHNGVTVDLFDHTAATTTNPDTPGVAGQGSQDSFNGNNTYTFALNGADLSVVSDPNGIQKSDVASGTYKATGNAQGGFDTANAGNSLASFIGQSVSGNWILTMTDHQPDDAGSFLGFSFTVNTPAAAPEPSQYAAFAVGLLGLGALGLRARRTRQNA